MRALGLFLGAAFSAAVASSAAAESGYAFTLLCTDGCSPENRDRIEAALSLFPASMKEAIAGPVRVRFEKQRTGLAGKTEQDWAGRLQVPYTIRVNNDYNAELKLRTLLHELAHIYDLGQPLGALEKAELEGCVHESARCRRLARKSARISGDPRFLALAGWRLNPSGHVERMNFLEERSPDRYEFSHPRESFAVQLEYFLLDPEYACRRPALDAYFRSVLRHAPPASANCDEPELDRIYQVQYLFAGPGASASSRWGHAMFRLVICAPHRQAPSAECLRDVAWHKIVSPRATLGELTENALKGLTGAYPSEIHLLGLSQVLREYTRDEFRDLESIPLRLTRQEVRDFGRVVLERFWSYRGKYRLLDNNCADESLALLQAALDPSRASGLEELSPALLTPAALREQLRRSGLLEEAATESFPSRKAAVVEALRSLVPDGQPGIDEILAWTPGQREAWGTRLLAGAAPSEASPTAARLLLIEDIAASRLQKQLEARTLAQWWESQDEASRSAVLDTRRTAGNHGYGVPLPGEREAWNQGIGQEAAKFRSELLGLAEEQGDLLQLWRHSLAIRQRWLRLL
ncbi:MAG: DUF4105 domain-containing protein [Oligoflexia bacterium]|nr:DUF4105 domain-containing protein [Oligoflexia bacterium]